MCGIAGFWESRDQNSAQDILNKMIVELNHRGPDYSNTSYDKNLKTFFGHARLSILDISENGHQPMESQSSRFSIVYNGEIYNHLELREKLKKDGFQSWNSSSDTETLLVCVEKYGLNKTLNMLEGMFAFALLDKLNKKIFLARDRVGEKPLYYNFSENFLCFASEFKSISKHPRIKFELSEAALDQYLRLGYVPAPYSINKNVEKVLPGELLTVDLENNSISKKKYWDYTKIATELFKDGYQGTFTEAVNEAESLIHNSVSKQLISDVPIGAFLSGGIDSSLICAVMSNVSNNQIKTFSIGFEDKQFDESGFAKEVAKEIGSDHTEFILDDKMALDFIPNIASIFSEPFADSSQIPTYFVSKLASKYVTVSLSGDAGDELFGGYNRYIFTNSLWKKLNYIPYNLRLKISNLLLQISPDQYEKLFSYLSFLNKDLVKLNMGDKVHKGLHAAATKDIFELYEDLISSWKKDEIFPSQNLPSPLENTYGELLALSSSPISLMMAMDTMTYLPDDILCKVDRSAMSVSLETRVPFLDRKILEFAASLPIEYKVKNGSGKIILKEILGKYVSSKLINRPKMGFAIPISSWLKGPLKPWAEDLLSSSNLLKYENLDRKRIHTIWEEHKSGKRNWSSKLWNILMYLSWADDFRNNQ
jgi:asparagine synthase (glutamine-hydrolysing)